MTDNFCKSIFFIYICNMETKVCIKCNTEKDVTEFYKNNSAKVNEPIIVKYVLSGK